MTTNLGRMRQGSELTSGSLLLSQGTRQGMEGNSQQFLGRPFGTCRSLSELIFLVDGPPGSVSQEKWGRRRQYFQ